MKRLISILTMFLMLFPQAKAETGLAKTLLNRAVENGKVAEYLIPDATYNNLFVKATDDEVLVGYIKTEENVDKNVDKLVVLADKKGTHALTNKLNEANESNIKNLADEVLELKGVGSVESSVGVYTTKIRWGIQDIDVRPFEKGYWGKRVPQTNPRVDAYELKINPNNESFYLPHPEGGYVQFENIVNSTVQDGKLIMDKSSIYYVAEKPDFLNTSSVLEPAQRQLVAAKAVGYKIEWLVSDEKAVQQLTQYFKEKNIDIVVKLLKE